MIKRRIPLSRFSPGHRPLRSGFGRRASGDASGVSAQSLAARLRSHGASEAVIAKVFPGVEPGGDKKTRSTKTSVRLGSEL